jgi:hypothetical protein
VLLEQKGVAEVMIAFRVGLPLGGVPADFEEGEQGFAQRFAEALV